MKWEDTVIRDFDKTRAYYPGEVEVKLEIQAEISFKAGEDKRDIIWIKYLMHKHHIMVEAPPKESLEGEERNE